MTTSLLALIDESNPARPGGQLLVVSSVIVLTEDRHEIRERALDVVARRKRVFRWRQDGRTVKGRMVALLNEHAVAGISRVAYPVAPKQLEASRSRVLGSLLVDLVEEGVDEVVIESRSEADHFDRATLANLAANRSVPDDLDVSWVGKLEPLLWLADAAAGIVAEHVAGTTTEAAQGVDPRLLDIRWA